MKADLESLINRFLTNKQNFIYQESSQHRSGNIEVEIRGLLTESTHQELINFLDAYATDREQDNRNTVIFNVTGFSLKVTHEIDKDRAKISIKSGDITKDKSMEETEIYVKAGQFIDVVSQLSALGFQPYPLIQQRRVNYSYKDVTISVKWSKNWGYHYKIEKMINDSSGTESAEKMLEQIAEGLGLKVLSTQEIEQIHQDIVQKQK